MKVAVFYLCDSKNTYIWAWGCGSISCPKNTIQHTGNTFNKYPPETQRKSSITNSSTVHWPWLKSWSGASDRMMNLPVDGMDGRWRSAREASTGVVISYWLDDAGYHSAQHADHTCSRHSGSAPLDCERKTEQSELRNIHFLTAKVWQQHKLEYNYVNMSQIVNVKSQLNLRAELPRILNFIYTQTDIVWKITTPVLPLTPNERLLS